MLLCKAGREFSQNTSTRGHLKRSDICKYRRHSRQEQPHTQNLQVYLHYLIQSLASLPQAPHLLRCLCCTAENKLHRSAHIYTFFPTPPEQESVPRRRATPDNQTRNMWIGTSMTDGQRGLIHGRSCRDGPAALGRPYLAFLIHDGH